MIQFYAREDNHLRQLQQAAPRCWINLHPPFEQNELESLAASKDIPLDYLTDSLDPDERSRYERWDDNLRFILIQTPILNPDEEENQPIYITVPIGLLISPEFILTISAHENTILKKFIDGKVKNFDPSDTRSCILQILDQNVWAYLDSLKRLNLKRNLIEQELYDSSRNAELKQLLRIEKSLVYFVNSLSANDLVKLKMKRTDFLQIAQDEEKADLFEDILIDNNQALDMANRHTNILSGTMEAYASIVSNNLNKFIQRLTVVTIILMVPTLVASFFGMNVHLPLSDKPMAFFYILFVSGLIIVFLVWFFRRKQMF
ncbi:MAG TPA: magnesium transporter CorA family protein [Saprospiraceae bacterium]|nr:magnesium transporter CorA family protein [Saprospiraceae bacterium]HNT19737.1 magnesium transporter CorA family protein [Saprospiraceae bacterium]